MRSLVVGVSFGTVFAQYVAIVVPAVLVAEHFVFVLCSVFTSIDFTDCIYKFVLLFVFHMFVVFRCVVVFPFCNDIRFPFFSQFGLSGLPSVPVSFFSCFPQVSPVIKTRRCFMLLPEL